MRPSVEQQRLEGGADQKQNLTITRTAENSCKPNTAPGLGVASTPAIQVHSAVVDPWSTTAAFSSVFDCGLAAARRSGTCDPLLTGSRPERGSKANPVPTALPHRRRPAKTAEVPRPKETE